MLNKLDVLLCDIYPFTTISDIFGGNLTSYAKNTNWLSKIHGYEDILCLHQHFLDVMDLMQYKSNKGMMASADGWVILRRPSKMAVNLR